MLTGLEPCTPPWKRPRLLIPFSMNSFPSRFLSYPCQLKGLRTATSHRSPSLPLPCSQASFIFLTHSFPVSCLVPSWEFAVCLRISGLHLDQLHWVNITEGLGPIQHGPSELYSLPHIVFISHPPHYSTLHKVDIFILRTSHGAYLPTIIIYGFHVFISGIYLDRVSTIPPGSISMFLCVYSIYLYFNMTASFFFIPLN